MRNTLIRLAIKYQGNYSSIVKAINEGEIVDEDIPLQRAITILDEKYPKDFFMLSKPPLVLFYQGDLNKLNGNRIAVVGSRHACKYGIKATINIVRSLRSKYTIVSGLALGIDTIAHRYAINTIAVLGNGLDVHYPKVNEEVYKYLALEQLILTEYPLGCQPKKEHFPFRNRLIAALSEKIIVAQAAQRSGTMLTVNEGLNLNKDIYAVPYPYNDPNGYGCNALIQQGANVITPETIIDL